MSIPDYQSLMMPLLKITGDKLDHTIDEVVEALSKAFNLTEDEKKQLLPSGSQPTFENRVGWARTYMKKAGLLEYTGKGSFRITERGLEILATHSSINTKFLRQFSEFRDFAGMSRQGGRSSDKPDDGIKEEEATPEEILENGYTELRRALAQEILDRVKKCSPRFFEQLVVRLLVSMGYGGSLKDAAQVVGKSGDGGIDGIIKEDKLGLETIYIQAKRWQNTVPVSIVREFAGSLIDHSAKKGVLITTSTFPQEAWNYVSRNTGVRIILVDGTLLADLMIEHNIGVSVAKTYEVKKIDIGYFEDV